MKRILLSVLIAAACVLAPAAPAFASDPVQVFDLFNASIIDKYGNTPMKYMATSGVPSGEVSIPANGKQMWIADRHASGDVVFSKGNWPILIATDADWGVTNNVSNFRAEIGTWDGSKFSGLPLSSSPVMYHDHFEFQAKSIPVGGMQINRDTYLAIVIYNDDPNNSHVVWTGHEYDQISYLSCIKTPRSDPGYPLPESGSIILLGGGLFGLGGFMLVRSRKLAHSI
jgi:hypothetical protein